MSLSVLSGDNCFLSGSTDQPGISKGETLISVRMHAGVTGLPVAVTLHPTDAQSSYQKDIKKKTAHLRQALQNCDEEAAVVYRSLPTITDPAANSSKSTKIIATEADDLVHNLTNTLTRWRRTSALAAETFAELLTDISNDKELIVELQSTMSYSDEEIQDLWTTMTRIQAEIDFVESLLNREQSASLDMNPAGVDSHGGLISKR